MKLQPSLLQYSFSQHSLSQSSLSQSSFSQPHFIVIDTEGSNQLREIAIIDQQGKVIYHALVQEHPANRTSQLNTKQLAEIVTDFSKLAQAHAIVCHNAQHDSQVLRQAYQQTGQKWQRSLRFICTVELAQHYLPNLPNYSLEYLSKKLHLRVNQKFFNPRQAHSARYDAEFTYQLYQKLAAMHSPQLTNQLAKHSSNPFSSSRVDTPFQNHPDQKQIYQNEFEQLKATIQEIRQDENNQSRGAVVIGEPGSGKTHLMMRLAKELLQVNRLLFIRAPNNADAILYHIYSRILESFIETIPTSGFTQLEHLLAHSFVKLISTQQLNPTKNDQVILSAVSDNPLNLYRLAAEGTERKRALWQHIEKRTNEWWVKEYGFAGHSAQIIKGVIKFCSYSEPRRRELVTRWLAANDLDAASLELIGLNHWNEDLSKEEFSLEAISVFSKLSLLDEPLIIVFDQLESLGQAHKERFLLNFGESIKELFTHVPNSLIILNLFPDRWQQFQQFFDDSVVDRISQTQLYLHRPRNQELRNILQIKAEAAGLDLDQFFSPKELETILNQPSIRKALNAASDYYRHKIHGIPLPDQPVPATEADSNKATPTVEQRLEHLETEFSKLQQVLKQFASVLSTAYLADTASDTSETASLPAVNTGAITPANTLLLDYLRTQRQTLAQAYSKPQIIADSDDLGKLITIAEAFKTLKDFQLDYLQLGKRKLPEHLVLQAQRQIAVGFLQIEGSAFTGRLKNWNELVLSHKEVHFQLWRDIRQPEITGKVGQAEIEKLNYSSNGVFLLLEQEQRLDFELIYQLITDVQNRDLEVELQPALELVLTELKDAWICQLINML